MATPELIPAELFLSAYPPDIRELAERLRGSVSEAVPDAIERVRIGWRLIGYDVPVGSRTRYFAFVAHEPGDTIPIDALVPYTREAAELATLRSAGRGRPGA